MKRFVLIACCLLAACTARKEPLSVRMVHSEMLRCPTAADLDGQQGNLKWNYTTGLELKAFLDVYKAYGDASILDYVEAWYDTVISPEGEIGGRYRTDRYSLDHICPGRTLLELNVLRQKEKYLSALRALFDQLQGQPRTRAGAFWHKAEYPGQVWLDGLYMGEPFYAEYLQAAGPDSLWNDIARQFEVAAEKTFDPKTGLWRHAWDEDAQMFWAHPETGQSAHAWGRALGWYTMGLSEVLDFFPQDHPRRKALEDILEQILTTLPRFADKKTQMWYQVLDRPGETGNYLESTCSAMFTYVYLREARTREARAAARKLYRNLVRAFIRENPDGTLSLVQCCAVAGLGGRQMRSGTYEYYINEKIVENDPKGIGPFIWASLTYEKEL